jgi:hypothetical protein
VRDASRRALALAIASRFGRAAWARCTVVPRVPDILNNREWASLIWLVAIVGGLAIAHEDIRTATWRCVRAFLALKVFASLLAMAAYVAAFVVAASYLGAWELELTGGTAIWFLTSAIALWFSASKVSDDPHYARKALGRAVGFTVVFEAIANLYVFPLLVELILVPTLALLAGMAALAEARPDDNDSRVIKRPLNILIGTFGLTIIAFAAIHIIADLTSGHFGHFLKGLVLPVWLGLSALPFIYLFGVGLAYSSAFFRLKMAFNYSPSAARRAKLSLMRGVRFHAYYLGGFAEPWPKRLISATTRSDARQIVAELCLERDQQMRLALPGPHSDPALPQ